MPGGTIFGGKVPVTEMAHCVAAHQRLLHTLAGFDDTTAKGPSLLPDWSRSYVVAHLARHAESNERMLRGLTRDEQIPQYAGGPAGRRRSIAESARQSAKKLVDDYRACSEALFAVWQDMPDDVWDRNVHTLRGPTPAFETAWIRWHELEVHHVDLDLGFGVRDWPAAYVHTALMRLVESMPERGLHEAPHGRWVLEATDIELAWTLETADGAEPLVTSAGPAAGADAHVSGPASALLAWVLGRPVPDGDLSVLGSRPEEAHTLPATFPLR